MDHPFHHQPPSNALFRSVVLILAVMVFKSCAEEPQYWEPKSQELVIGDYISAYPEQFSEFEKLIELSGLGRLLNIRGPYTVFLPINQAMLDFYEMKNVKSLEEFDKSYLENLILNHIVAVPIESGDIGLGALRDTNGLGDYLASEFEGSDIIISKTAKIINRDIRAANGFIHVIDKVLDLITDDIYTVVSSDPSYGILSEGLALTGLKDTLELISFPFGTRVARTRFTLLAVPDTIYHRYGINDVNDLIDWCDANPDSVMYIENPFYRYIEYHCLNGSYFLSDFNTGIYSILSRDNNVAFAIEEDYKINRQRTTGEYTGFIIPASNTPAKNGVVHAVDDLLPVIEPEPAEVLFETTDFFDLRQGDYYRHHYQRFFDGQNSFEKIKWKGDYLLYYYNILGNGTNIYDDCLSMQNWWSISITFPKVMKGKYEVFIYQPGWQDVTDCVAYIDGEGTPYIYTGPYGTGNGGLQKIADVDFTTTTEHTITVKNITAGMLFWDYVLFRPVE